MEKNVPVLIGIAVVGALSGVVIAGQGASLGTVSAAPGAQSAAARPTTIVGDNDAVSTIVTTTVVADPTATTVVVDSSTTTVVVDTAAPVTTVGPTLAAQTVEDTTDIPIEPPAPDVTLDIPTVPPPVDEEDEESEGVVPWPSSSDRATLRLVMVNADTRPDLDELATRRLVDQGYGQITVGNDVAPAEYTTVYYRPGFNRAAVTVTIDLEAENVSLEPMPENAAPLTSADGQGDVIVYLGPDIPA